MEICRKILTFAPMKRERKQDLALFGMQLFVWLLLMLAPAGISYFINPSGHGHWLFLWNSVSLIAPMMVVYMISYYVLLPLLFYRGHKLWYVLCSLLLIALINIRFILADVSMLNGMAKTGFYNLATSSVTIDVLVVLGAFAFRSYQRSHVIQRELEEERRKSTEAELHWLKNQLNPHFLFNSLNNISSLTQIDPDQAQDAIAQLSDLLRYALYESNKPMVPLSGELEFMRNYISLMRLRCSSLTEVEEALDMRNEVPGVRRQELQIAPLLFISFIENAFKHGTSNNQPSSVKIRLHVEDGKIFFECQNTNFPKADTDRSGSGVGLENTRRRLDLLYAGRYDWKQSVEDGIYTVRVMLTL